jgi:hypothetical protein
MFRSDNKVRVGRHKRGAKINNDVTGYDIEEPAGDNKPLSREGTFVALLAPVKPVFQR